MWYILWGKMIKRHPYNKLTAVTVKKLSKPGKYADGNNLYLHIDPSGARRWILRLTVGHRRRDMGLGNTMIVSLEEARKLARLYRGIAKSGGDPFVERQKERGFKVTFIFCAQKVHELNRPTWKNEKFALQWYSSLENHVFPKIGNIPVSQITSSDILGVLSPIWNNKSDTARKLKQRIRLVFKWARAKGYFQGDDPVELAEQALPKKKRSDNHHKSLPYNEIPDLIVKIKKSKISLPTQLAIQFTIQSACRTSEVLKASWNEIDMNSLTWTIPANRMKTDKVHEVPISSGMLDILNEAKEKINSDDLIFSSDQSGNALSNNTLRLAVQKRLGIDTTIHGMRSSFKDWASETTNFANEVSEMALAHVIPNKTEAAYRRGNLMDKRRHLMQMWSDHVNNNQDKIIHAFPQKGDKFGS
ncbi:integrase arm-type DNA-binding domain-containing protein [Alphaproteobacteria bacterium]|nr:integrase arm-type DNA-binding domain-containing protein [Alphaproteobacteria bacterium]